MRQGFGKFNVNVIAALKSAVLGVAILFSALNVFAGSPPPVFHQLRTGVTGIEIQQALDALPESGGVVILPQGTINLTRPIVLNRSHQTLRGSGTATILRLADNANCPV